MNRVSKLSPILAVAKWEFGRYFKLRDQVIGMVSLLLGGLIGLGSVKLVQHNSEIKVAVNSPDLKLQLSPDSKIKLVETNESVDNLKSAIRAKDFDAALIVPSETTPASASPQYELLVRSEPTWLNQLQTPLNQLQSRQVMLQQGLTEERLATIFAPVKLTVTNLTDSSISKLDQFLAMMVMLLVILTSWLGLAYFLSGISGEKQQRVTEQVVSAISAQSWIDGKLLGISAASIATAMNFVVTAAVSLVIARWFGFEFSLPGSAARTSLVVWVLLYYFGGVFLWNCFYAAVATIINDPNTSARSSLIFVPLLPMAAAAMAMAKPDGVWMQMLSIVPGSSVTAMPMRLLLSEVPAWELLVSLLALAWLLSV